MAVRRRKKLNKVERAITCMLEERGYDKERDAALFDMAKDYADLWRLKESLLQDIQERGVQIKWQNGASASGYKKNDSIDGLIKTNAQMLKILAFLKIEPDDLPPDEEVADSEDGL